MLIRTFRIALVALSLTALTVASPALAAGKNNSSSTSTGTGVDTGGDSSGGGSTSPTPTPTTAQPCATLDFTMSATALTYYGTSTFTTNVGNCSTADETVTITYTSGPNNSASCKAGLATWSDTAVLRAGKSEKIVTTQYTPACYGTDTVVATVRSTDGTVLASSPAIPTSGGQKRGGLAGL